VRRQLVVLSLAVVGVVPLLAGCAFFDGPSDDGLDGEGQVLATYTSGHATLKIDGSTMVLDQLGGESELISGFGADVYWYNDAGWGLRFEAYGDSGLSGNDVRIERVQTTYWATDGGGDCVVKVEKADATGLKGSATCHGLRWVDQLRGSRWGSDGPNYVKGEPAFDATIKFQAAPASPAPSSQSVPRSPAPSSQSVPRSQAPSSQSVPRSQAPSSPAVSASPAG
jgi:hypothetical protein